MSEPFSAPQPIRIRYTVFRRTGERVEIRQHADGGYICPVCGSVDVPGGEAPWEDTVVELSGEPFATGSQCICGTCNTQYGYDDIPPAHSGLTISDMWWRRRIMWLDEVGWRPQAIVQITEHLGITEEELRRQADEIRKRSGP